MLGEGILWAGQPARGFLFEGRDIFFIPFFLVWLAMTVGVPLYQAVRTGDWSNRFFILPFVLFGAYILGSRLFYDPWLRRRTFYAVTDQRILIWRAGLSSSFLALDRRGIEAVDLEERGARGTIIFRPVGGGVRTSSQGRGHARAPETQLSFRAIQAPRAVFDLIQRTRPGRRTA